MAETITIDFSKPLPLFPLPGVVLMPHAATPLHVFEPRYRAMTNHALDSNGLIAMATPAPAEVVPGLDTSDDDAATEPHDAHLTPLDEAVCLGYISQHQPAGDGRYHILLLGLTRARIADELEPHEDGYRQALLRPLETREASDEALERVKESLMELIADEALSQLSVIQMAQEWMEQDLAAVPLIDLLTQALCTDSSVRYANLADTDPIRRGERLVAYLRKTKNLIDSAGDPDDNIDDTGSPLN